MLRVSKLPFTEEHILMANRDVLKNLLAKHINILTTWKCWLSPFSSGLDALAGFWLRENQCMLREDLRCYENTTIEHLHFSCVSGVLSDMVIHKS